MSPDQSPFPTAWPFAQLKGYRDHPQPATYSWFSYAALPRLPEELLRGDFGWLATQPNRWNPGNCQLATWEQDREDLLHRATEKFAALRRSADEKGVAIPPEFFRFMEDPDLIHRIRSATDCYFEPSQRLAESPREDGGYFIHFLSDQQGCLFWNLYLSAKHGHCVVASEQYFGDDKFDDEDDEESVDGLHFCAPLFEAFIYRFWLENEIWYSINQSKWRWWAPWRRARWSDAQKRYVEHYRALRPT
jgi:hypothetical protein